MSEHSVIDIKNSSPIGGTMLSELLGRDFGKASSPAPERLTADLIPAVQVADSQLENLLIQSGYKPNLNAYSSFHEVETDGDEEKDRKRKRVTMNMAKAMSSADIFHHKGFNLNFDEVMDGIDRYIGKKGDELEQAEAALPVEEHEIARHARTGQPITDPDRFEHLYQIDKSLVEGRLTPDMITEVNGVQVETGVLVQIKEIKAELSDAETYQAQLVALTEKHGADSTEVKEFIAGTDEALADQIIVSHEEIEHGRNTDPDHSESAPDEVLTAETAPAENAPKLAAKPDTYTP